MRRWILALLAAGGLGGCTVWPAPLGTPSISGLTTQQRVVISQVRPIDRSVSQNAHSGQKAAKKPQTGPEQDGVRQQHVVTCAEPSPDALSANSSALGGSLTAPVGGTKTISASAGIAAGTNLAYVGMRTVMIQALRDLGYRACEAYMNGAIGASEYRAIVIGAPRIILGIETIDALAGPAPVPPVVLTAPSETASGGNNGNAAVQGGTNSIGPSSSNPRDAQSWKYIAPVIQRIACIALVVPPPGVGQTATKSDGKSATGKDKGSHEALRLCLNERKK